MTLTAVLKRMDRKDLNIKNIGFRIYLSGFGAGETPAFSWGRRDRVSMQRIRWRSRRLCSYSVEKALPQGRACWRSLRADSALPWRWFEIQQKRKIEAGLWSCDAWSGKWTLIRSGGCSMGGTGPRICPYDQNVTLDTRSESCSSRFKTACFHFVPSVRGAKMLYVSTDVSFSLLRLELDDIQLILMGICPS